jgi:hypothetical protein
MKTIHYLVLSIFFPLALHAQDGWQKKDLSEREKVNLSVVSDMYGYARYFYPNPQNDEIDWTKFLMYAIEKAETASNDDELLKTLDELFRPLLPDAVFKSDSLPLNYRLKKKGGFYLRSHYHPSVGRYPRIRDYKENGKRSNTALYCSRKTHANA